MFWNLKRIRKLTINDLRRDPPTHTQMHYIEGYYDPFIYEKCPRCESTLIRVGNSCHTYEQNGKWVSCMNCGSAGDLYCDTEDCHWNYEWGLNPRNPRAEANEKNRPTWLVGKWPY